MAHNCVCRDWPGGHECHCGVYKDEEGRAWCANENCRALLDAVDVGVDLLHQRGHVNGVIGASGNR